MLSSRLNSSEAMAGAGYELTVIAAVVIGGTSLFGGIGGVAGTVVGAILIGVLINGLVLMNVSPTSSRSSSASSSCWRSPLTGSPKDGGGADRRRPVSRTAE